MTSTPPTTGPMIPPIGKMLVNMPIARSRSRPNWSATMPVADGMIAPAARPWNTRTHDEGGDVARHPAHSEVRVNIVMATRKIVLRPNWSLSLPAMGMDMIWPSA